MALYLCVDKLQRAYSSNDQEQNIEARLYTATMLISRWNLHIEVRKTHPLDHGKKK